jgi:hypothetical protein
VWSGSKVIKLEFVLCAQNSVFILKAYMWNLLIYTAKIALFEFLNA